MGLRTTVGRRGQPRLALSGVCSGGTGAVKRDPQRIAFLASRNESAQPLAEAATLSGLRPHDAIERGQRRRKAEGSVNRYRLAGHLRLRKACGGKSAATTWLDPRQAWTSVPRETSRGASLQWWKTRVSAFCVFSAAGAFQQSAVSSSRRRSASADRDVAKSSSMAPAFSVPRIRASVAFTVAESSSKSP